MRLPRQPRLPPIKDPLTAADLNRALSIMWEEISRVVNGLLWFGSVATGRDNLDGETKQQTDTGAANTAFSLVHNLGRIPVGFLVVYTDKATSIYDGGVAWTTETISLKSSTANVLLRVFVF